MGKEVPMENGSEIRRNKASSGSDPDKKGIRMSSAYSSICFRNSSKQSFFCLPNRLALGKLLRALRDHSSTTATILGASGLRA